MKMKFVLCLLVLSATQLTAQKIIPPPMVQEAWSKPFEPFHIVGNVYYVGTYDLASYLIVTKEGNILINTGLAESAPLIKKNIETLGFKTTDIKILLTTQAHFDHVGAMAELKEITHASMMTLEGDVAVLADGGNSDYVFGGKGSTFKSVRTDRVLKDNDIIKLGETTVTVHNSAGHTRGSTSFSFPVKEGNKTYRVLIANMPTILEDVKLAGMPGYPDVSKDFAATFVSMKKIQFDIFLASHASQFGMHEKYKTGDAYDAERFLDHGEFLKALNELEEIYKRRLKEGK
jgi:metallo-beta-lactamase class B